MAGSIMTEKQDNVLTIEELAVYLKISKSSLYSWPRRGRSLVRRLVSTGGSGGTLSTSGLRTAKQQPKENKKILTKTNVHLDKYWLVFDRGKRLCIKDNWKREIHAAG